MLINDNTKVLMNGQLKNLELKQLLSYITTFKFVLIDIIPTKVRENVMLYQ